MKSIAYIVLQTYVYDSVLGIKYFCTTTNFWRLYIRRYINLSNPVYMDGSRFWLWIKNYYGSKSIKPGNPLSFNPTKWSNTLIVELFQCVWPFCGVGAYSVNNVFRDDICWVSVRCLCFSYLCLQYVDWNGCWNVMPWWCQLDPVRLCCKKRFFENCFCLAW